MRGLTRRRRDAEFRATIAARWRALADSFCTCDACQLDELRRHTIELAEEWER